MRGECHNLVWLSGCRLCPLFLEPDKQAWMPWEWPPSRLYCILTRTDRLTIDADCLMSEYTTWWARARLRAKENLSRKYDTQCCLNVGSPSQTVAQHSNDIGSTSVVLPRGYGQYSGEKTPIGSSHASPYPPHRGSTQRKMLPRSRPRVRRTCERRAWEVPPEHDLPLVLQEMRISHLWDKSYKRGSRRSRRSPNRSSAIGRACSQAGAPALLIIVRCRSAKPNAISTHF